MTRECGESTRLANLLQPQTQQRQPPLHTPPPLAALHTALLRLLDDGGTNPGRQSIYRGTRTEGHSAPAAGTNLYTGGRLGLNLVRVNEL